jgi:hypothetical protein
MTLLQQARFRSIIYIYIYIYVCMYVCIQTLKWGSFGDLNKWINEERHYIT